MNDDDSPDPDATERLQLLEDEFLRLAKGFHDIFAGDPEWELFSADLSQAKLSDRQIHDLAQTLYSRYGRRVLAAFALLIIERLIADEDEVAMAYKRILSAMVAIESIEPEPDEKIH